MMKTPTLKELIIIHINYRDVFNASVNLEELCTWLGLSDSFGVLLVLKQLVAEGLLETDGQLNYCVKGRSETFLHKTGKKRLSKRCLIKHAKIIHLISWLPFIRFIGISGSIAAENPTMDKVGYHKDSVDLDIFIITSSNALWLVFYLERLLTTIFIFLLGRRYVFCFNYAMDYSFLEIHNKNIYTATELFNLKPMYDKDNTYSSLVRSNAWAKKYYPSLGSGQIESKNKPAILKANEMLRYPFNLCAFYLFHLSRVIKNFSVNPLFEMKLKFNPAFRGNLTRICNANGGYENPIMERFESCFKKNFINYYRVDLMQYVFPVQEKTFPVDPFFEKLIREGFTKYSIS